MVEPTQPPTCPPKRPLPKAWVLLPIAISFLVGVVLALRSGADGSDPDAAPRWVGLVAILVGGYVVSGGTFDWDWFMLARKARFWVRSLGRTGARWLYVVLGSALIVFGLLLTAGVPALRP